MNRFELLNLLESLKFDSNEYWLITGAAMVFYGFRKETGDLDLGCTSKLADELEAKGHPVEIMPDGTRKICPVLDVEIFENWLYDQVEIIDSIPVISVKGLIAMKKSIGREKDIKDIQLIESCLDNR
jgi:hypothetical protein